MSPFNQAGIFLIQTLFDLYLMMIMLRFLLQVFRAEFYNPISQLVVRLTNPLLIPLRRVIPGFKGIDWSSITLLLIVTIIKLTLVCLIQFHRLPSIPGLVVWSVGDLVGLTIHIFFFAVLIQIIASWIAPSSHNPALDIIRCLTNPLMRPARKYIPAIGGFDLSPIPVIIGLQLLTILLAGPIIQVGAQLSLR